MVLLLLYWLLWLYRLLWLNCLLLLHWLLWRWHHLQVLLWLHGLLYSLSMDLPLSWCIWLSKCLLKVLLWKSLLYVCKSLLHLLMWCLHLCVRHRVMVWRQGLAVDDSLGHACADSALVSLLLLVPSISWMSLVEIHHMSHLLVVPPLPDLSSLNFLTTMSFNSVIPFRDSARADWRSESAELNVMLTASNLVVGIYVSRCKMFDGSQVDSDWEVSWHGSMCTVSRLDDEPAAALAWEADPLGSLNSVFAVRWRTMWSLRKWKLSLVHFCLSVSIGSPGLTSCEWLSRRVCAGSGTIFSRHL